MNCKNKWCYNNYEDECTYVPDHYPEQKEMFERNCELRKRIKREVDKQTFVVDSPSGKIKLFLEISQYGFTLWEEKGHQWIVDASDLTKSGTIEVSTEKKCGILEHIEVEDICPGTYRFGAKK